MPNVREPLLNPVLTPTSNDPMSGDKLFQLFEHNLLEGMTDMMARYA
jgi:hypothetical protein